MTYRFKFVLATLIPLGFLTVFRPPGMGAAEVAVVKPGDKVGIQFTCRLQNGEIAASTSTAVAADSSLRKSPVYLPRSKDDPLLVTAGQSTEKKNFPVPFLDEIVARVAASIPGTKLGETRTIEIRSDRPADVPEKEQFLDLSRVWQHPKEIRMTKDEYKTHTGKDPEVGADYKSRPFFPCQVASVSENEVVVRTQVKPAAAVNTPFGKGTVRENGSQMEIVIDAAKGTLVRMGPIVGRISGADEKMFTIDFGDPFGGQKLSCEVKTETIPENKLSKKDK